MLFISTAFRQWMLLYNIFFSGSETLNKDEKVSDIDSSNNLNFFCVIQ